MREDEEQGRLACLACQAGILETATARKDPKEPQRLFASEVAELPSYQCMIIAERRPIRNYDSVIRRHPHISEF
jgi:hypothetical protein